MIEGTFDELIVLHIHQNLFFVFHSEVGKTTMSRPVVR